MSQDYADLFCELFDRLDPAAFRADGERWLAEAQATADAVEQAALAGAPVAPGADEVFGALLGLDAALAHANPLSGTAARPRSPNTPCATPRRAGSTRARPPARCSPASPARAAAGN